jgi:hypothetical protein
MSAISQLGTLGDVLDYLVERGLKASEADHLVKLVLEFGIEAAKVRKGLRAKPVRNTEPKVERGFPDDLVLSEPLIAYAGRNGFVGQRVIDMWEDFHNHHRRKGSRFRRLARRLVHLGQKPGQVSGARQRHRQPQSTDLRGGPRRCRSSS